MEEWDKEVGKLLKSGTRGWGAVDEWDKRVGKVWRHGTKRWAK